MKIRTLVLGLFVGLGASLALYPVSVLVSIYPGFKYYFAIGTAGIGLILALLVLLMGWEEPENAS